LVNKDAATATSVDLLLKLELKSARNENVFLKDFCVTQLEIRKIPYNEYIATTVPIEFMSTK
jgi:hypothetical protein